MCAARAFFSAATATAHGHVSAASALPLTVACPALLRSHSPHAMGAWLRVLGVGAGRFRGVAERSAAARVPRPAAAPTTGRGQQRLVSRARAGARVRERRRDHRGHGGARVRASQASQHTGARTGRSRAAPDPPSRAAPPRLTSSGGSCASREASAGHRCTVGDARDPSAAVAPAAAAIGVATAAGQPPRGWGGGRGVNYSHMILTTEGLGSRDPKAGYTDSAHV